jgi:hypothetical protein
VSVSVLWDASRAAALIPLNERWAMVLPSVVACLSWVKMPADDEGAVRVS